MTMEKNELLNEKMKLIAEELESVADLLKEVDPKNVDEFKGQCLIAADMLDEIGATAAKKGIKLLK